MAEPIMMTFVMWTQMGQRNHVLDGVQVLSQDGQYEGKRGLAQDISGYVWWSVYSERVSRGKHWYDAYVDLGVLDGGAQPDKCS